MINSFYTNEELHGLGFKSVGKDVLISKKASFYNCRNITIGNKVRIDDFCILSGSINIGSFVHISAYSALYGSKGIYIGDFSGLSPKTVIFSAMDDFSGEYLINPMVPDKFTSVTGGKVIVKSFVQLGVNSVVFPNLEVGKGCVTGAFTLVNKSLKEWGVYVGVPARRIKERKKNLLKFVSQIYSV